MRSPVSDSDINPVLNTIEVKIRRHKVNDRIEQQCSMFSVCNCPCIYSTYVSIEDTVFALSIFCTENLISSTLLHQFYISSSQQYL